LNPTAVSVVAAGLMATVVAQQPASSASPASGPSRESRVFSVSVSLVQVDVVVTDSHGRPVTDLRPDDFEVLQDGQRRDVAHVFYVSTLASALPPSATTVEASTPARGQRAARRTLVFVVDDLSLSYSASMSVRANLKTFFDTQMQPDDQVAIVGTGSGIGAVQQLTSDKRLLLEAVKRIRWNARAVAPAPFGATGLHSDDRYRDIDSEDDDMRRVRGSLLSTATLATIRFTVEGLADLPGRKTLVLFSGGLGVLAPASDPQVKNAVSGLVEQANRASVVVYAVDSSTLKVPGMAAEDASGYDPAPVDWALPEYPAFGDDVLSYLARQTGGLLVDYPGRGLRRVLADQNGYYLLGFAPEASTFQRHGSGPGYHRIEVRVRRPGLRVRSRAGFYGVPDLEPPPKPALTRGEQLRAAITSPFAPAEMGIRLLSVFRNDPSTGPLVHSLVHIDGSDLTFVKEQDGRSRGAFELLAVIFDGSGVAVDRKAQAFIMRQSQNSGLEEVLARGVVYGVDLAVKRPGAYQVRVAVRDAASGRVGSASQLVEAPDLSKGRLALSGIVMRGSVVDPVGEAATAEAELPSDAGIGEEGLPISRNIPPGASPSVRRLRAGMALDYAFEVYNAHTEGAGGPRLELGVRLLRNGRELYRGPLRPLILAAQSRWNRVAIQGRINLGRDLEHGEYILEILVSDTLADRRRGTASQIIDFEIADG